MTDIDAWTWSPGALGPFDCRSPFSLDAIARHLPGYALERSEDGEDNPGSRTIAATPDGGSEPTLFFLGHRETDFIVAVRVREPGRIANAWHVGSRFDQTLLRPEDCFATHEVPGREGDFFCRAAGEPDGPVYWFRTSLAETGGLLPPGDILRESELYEISWTAFPPA